MSGETLLFLTLCLFWLMVFLRSRRRVVCHDLTYHALKRQQHEREMRAEDARWERESALRDEWHERDWELFRMKRETDQRYREHQQRIDEQIRQSRKEVANHVLALHRGYIVNKGRTWRKL